MADDFPKSSRRSRRDSDEPRDLASVIGRVPPHSIEAEEYLLSCCFLDGADIVARCLEGKLTATAFYSPANRVIFDKLVDLYNKGVPI
ncbi:MAG: replicative DNA helicase, partial [Opitutaceae bacterium]|nr:replicative DNA helicase [Opitutaceae bacterium]